MFGRVGQAEQPLLQVRPCHRGDLLQRGLQSRLQAEAVRVLHALIPDHAVQGLEDYLARRNPCEKTALRREIIEQFAQRREQVRLVIVAHQFRQRGIETAQDPVQRNGRRLRPGHDGRMQFLGGNSLGELRGQQARGIGKRSGCRVGLIQLVASPAYEQIAA